MNRPLIAGGILAAMLTLTGCGGDNAVAETSAPPSDPLDQMLVTFNGSPSKSEIQEALDDALNATETPITSENYSKAGSVLVTFRQKYGINEMKILDCIPTAVTDPRAPEPTFPNVAAVCNADLVEGTR